MCVFNENLEVIFNCNLHIVKAEKVKKKILS